MSVTELRLDPALQNLANQLQSNSSDFVAVDLAYSRYDEQGGLGDLIERRAAFEAIQVDRLQKREVVEVAILPETDVVPPQKPTAVPLARLANELASALIANVMTSSEPDIEDQAATIAKNAVKAAVEAGHGPTERHWPKKEIALWGAALSFIGWWIRKLLRNNSSKV